MTRLMTLALEGRPQDWDPVVHGLRDALVTHARQTTPYWAAVAPRGIPFEEIPPLTKTIVRERWDDLHARGVPEERRVPGVTSGSSGQPSHFVVDNHSYGAHLAGLNALRIHCGIPLDSFTSFMIVSDQPKNPLPEGWTHFSIYDLNRESVAAVVRAWSALGRYWIYAMPTGLSRVIDFMERLGVRPDPGPLAVVTSAETLAPGAARRIRDTFGCPVHSWYGSREIAGYLATTVDGGPGYAFNPLLSHLEVVDDDGRAVAPGEVGRILVTDLHNRAFPMIRYDTQDLGRASQERVGAWPTIGALGGRAADRLGVPGAAPRTLASHA
ncbi:MAG: hypothetical protein RLN63_01345, partial [Miltoncostaeaceae bacterium]